MKFRQVCIVTIFEDRTASVRARAESPAFFTVSNV